jgi:hypothetical protein
MEDGLVAEGEVGEDELASSLPMPVQCQSSVESAEWKNCAGDASRDRSREGGSEYEFKISLSIECVGDIANGARKGRFGRDGVKLGNSVYRGDELGEEDTVAFAVDAALAGLAGSEISEALDSESPATELEAECIVAEEETVLDRDLGPEFARFRRR